MTWLHNDIPLMDPPLDAVGFIYCITNITNDRKYIGKKFFNFTKTTYKVVKLKNGTKKRRKIKSQITSDWQDYWGSNDELKRDVAMLGIDKFRREILHFCWSKAALTYLELKEQILRNVLETDEYYNGQILARCHKSHIKGKLTESKQGHL